MADTDRKGIIFDLDGTMWNSLKQIIPAYKRVLSKYEDIEIDITEEKLKKCMGKTLEEIGEMLFPQIDSDRIKKILSECAQEELVEIRKKGGTLYPRLKETLGVLKQNYGLFIVSNCEDGYIESFLEYHQVKDLFDDYEYVGRTGKSKGENIKEIIRRNRVDKAAYVGDTQGDIDAADLAGIPFIFASYGFGRVDRQTPSIASFDELPEVINKVI